VNTKSRIGVVVGGVSIAFSSLCFLVTPVFTGALVLAAFFGAISGAIALALKARRTALMAFIFALTPLCGFLILENVVERVGTGYVMFIPIVAAFAIAVWVLVDYSKGARTAPPVT
jgi:uncharacterized protein YqhQ